MFKKAGLLLLVCTLLTAAVCIGGCTKKEEAVQPLILSHQTWTESIILGELFRNLIEERTDIPLQVVDLESFMIQWSAFQEREIELIPTYTSTAYMTVLEDTGLRDPDAVYEYVREQFEEQFDAIWLARLGFYNNYDLAVRPEIAEQYNLETYSDLAEVAGELSIAADVNFFDRPDCYPLLQEKYGMDFGAVKTVGVMLKYPAIENGEVDVVNCYTTDAQVDALGLRVLADDLHAFPPYDAAPLISAEALQRYPELEGLFEELAGKVTNDKMREMNYRVEVLEEDPADVARGFLAEAGVI